MSRSVLVSGMYLRGGINVIIAVIDEEEHQNNLYLYGYPAKRMYIPFCKVASHSEVVENHDVRNAFDYSSRYFYLKTEPEMFVEFENAFFE